MRLGKFFKPCGSISKVTSIKPPSKYIRQILDSGGVFDATWFGHDESRLANQEPKLGKNFSTISLLVDPLPQSLMMIESLKISNPQIGRLDRKRQIVFFFLSLKSHLKMYHDIFLMVASRKQLIVVSCQPKAQGKVAFADKAHRDNWPNMSSFSGTMLVFCLYFNLQTLLEGWRLTATSTRENWGLSYTLVDRWCPWMVSIGNSFVDWQFLLS